MAYRFSASLIKVYKGCKFRFYCKHTNQNVDTVSAQHYGDAGNVVHKCLEYYYGKLKGKFDHESEMNELQSFFESNWDHEETANLEKNLYWLSVINGVQLKLDYTHLEYKFYFTDPVEFIGYADIMNTKDNWIGDWKTSTYKKSKVDEYKEQLKYYAYAYFREFGVNPMCWVFFNKVNKIFKFKFDDSVLKGVEKELNDLSRDILKRLKTDDFPREPENKSCFFCPYKGICSTDLLKAKPENAGTMDIRFHLDKNKLKIEGEIPLQINEDIQKAVNFEVQNAHFIKKAMKAKGIEWDGIKRLYKLKPFGAETFIGYTDLVYRKFKSFCDIANLKLNVTLIDHRSQSVMESEMFKIPKLNVPFTFYEFQNEAVDALIKHRWGICEVGTGGGKTAIAAECIRRIGTRTLFVIDNKDLLLQTKQEYESMLGVECGIVGMGKTEWDYPIVLSTIQTLAKHLKTFAGPLSVINLVIYDETHIIAAKSFEKLSKYLVNTKYRLGFSATAKRDDGNDNIIYAHTGQVVYKRTARWLIDNGYLVEPKVIFYKYKAERIMPGDWQDEYTTGIVENEYRNNFILKLAKDFVDKGKSVMILCTRTLHCKFFLDSLKDYRSALIYGKTDDDVRFETLAAFRKKGIDILIGNIKIFNKGINIKNLDVLINATGNAGDVVTVQSIGRALRKFPGKEDAYYIDFVDSGEYLRKHSATRIEALKAEKYQVDIKSE